jgi:hypothetical protein
LPGSSSVSAKMTSTSSRVRKAVSGYSQYTIGIMAKFVAAKMIQVRYPMLLKAMGVMKTMLLCCQYSFSRFG